MLLIYTIAWPVFPFIRLLQLLTGAATLRGSMEATLAEGDVLSKADPRLEELIF